MCNLIGNDRIGFVGQDAGERGSKLFHGHAPDRTPVVGLTRNICEVHCQRQKYHDERHKRRQRIVRGRRCVQEQLVLENLVPSPPHQLARRNFPEKNRRIGGRVNGHGTSLADGRLTRA